MQWIGAPKKYFVCSITLALIMTCCLASEPKINIRLSPSVTSTSDSSPSPRDVLTSDLPIPAIVVAVLCFILIILALVVLILLVKKTKRRVIVIRPPDTENPQYNNVTVLDEPGTGQHNVFKRLSLRIINRFSIYSSQGDNNTLTRQTLPSLSMENSIQTLTSSSPLEGPTPLISNHLNMLDDNEGPFLFHGRDYEITTPSSTDSNEVTMVTKVHRHKRDDPEIYDIPGGAIDLKHRTYSQLCIPVYSDFFEEGFFVLTEEDRQTRGSLCDHFVQQNHHYNKLNFFEQSDDFWLPASTTSGLYTQLAIKKYREIQRNQIKISKALGSGYFAAVFKGEWCTHERLLDVAIKILRKGSNELDRLKFLQEAAIMGQFSHPNIVRLHGVVTIGEPTMIVLELLCKGDLLTYLRRLHPTPEPKEQDPLQRLFLKFARDIASGMEHLASKSFIHRDLAARNILLSDDLTCKIGDFGMARDLLDEDYYNSRGGKIPVKWTAPEALLYKKYSIDSDLWSYGILLYEIWSLGKKPFADITNNEMISLAQSGLCHCPPPGLPKAIYVLMVDCWNPQHSKRPKFDQICRYLSQPESVLLHWSDRDLSISPLTHVLGASLGEAQGLYKDLQQIYILQQTDGLLVKKKHISTEICNRSKRLNSNSSILSASQTTDTRSSTEYLDEQTNSNASLLSLSFELEDITKTDTN